MKNRKEESVEQFKVFVKEHPKMRDVVKKGEKTWQEFFEEWYLLGDGDGSWRKYKEEKPNVESVKTEKKEKNFIKAFLDKKGQSDDGGNMLETITGYVKKMDSNQIDTQITNIRSAIDNIQKIANIFSPSSGGGSAASTSSSSERKEQKTNHFKFRKD